VHLRNLLSWNPILRVEFTTGLSVKPEMLVGIEEVRKADREDEPHACSSNWHHGG